jgi:hypothetical protein
MFGYKNKDGQDARRLFLMEINKCIILPADTSLIEKNNDVLDAAVCVFAGVDFLRGEVYEPTDLALSRKEGWIWVREGEEST